MICICLLVQIVFRASFKKSLHGKTSDGQRKIAPDSVSLRKKSCGDSEEITLFRVDTCEAFTGVSFLVHSFNFIFMVFVDLCMVCFLK